MKNLDDWLLIGGSALVMLGIGMISIPGAVIYAGMTMIGFGYLVGRKQADDDIAK